MEKVEETKKVKIQQIAKVIFFSKCFRFYTSNKQILIIIQNLEKFKSPGLYFLRQ